MWATTLSAIGTVIAAVATLAAAGAVFYQAKLLRKQIQLQGLLELDMEWNSEDMVEKRSCAWTEANDPNLDEVEGVLEFLEKVSSLQQSRMLQAKLIWDLALGWYLIRYFHYCRDVIEELRRKHTLMRDPTLYEDLETLYGKLLRLEAKNRSRRGEPVTEAKICQELDAKRKEFAESERGVNSDGHAHS
jgi:hypothetical protein